MFMVVVCDYGDGGDKVNYIHYIYQEINKKFQLLVESFKHSLYKSKGISTPFTSESCRIFILSEPQCFPVEGRRPLSRIIFSNNISLKFRLTLILWFEKKRIYRDNELSTRCRCCGCVIITTFSLLI